jgi:GNAT superfamily N-acetyltransferase
VRQVSAPLRIGDHGGVRDEHRSMSSAPGGRLHVRPATDQDSGEILRLASLMYEAMGVDAGDEPWRVAAARALSQRLGHDAAVFVVDDPVASGRLAACGAASIATRLPGPANPDARVGYIQWISTDPIWRRRGMARAVTESLIAWLREQGVRSVELHATGDGVALYRSLGFAEGQNPGLRRRI